MAWGLVIEAGRPPLLILHRFRFTIMPVRVKCSCGKVLSVRDELAGKAVKCPGCAKPIRVPTAAAKQTVAAQKAGTKKAGATVPVKGELDDLFAEEGFDRHVAAACPACGVEMKAGSVLCTKCGFNKTTGVKMDSHQTAGVDIDMGTLALNAAEKSMQRDVSIQKEMHAKAGMPWWMLLVVLFVLGSGSLLAVITVNAANREEESLDFSPMKTFLAGTGGLIAFLSLMAQLAVLVAAFKKSTKQGLLSLFVPFYLFYFAITNRFKNLKLIVLSVIGFALAGYLFFEADRYVPGKSSVTSGGNTIVQD